MFQWLSNSNFLTFITKFKLNNGNQNQTFFHGTYSNLTSYFLSKNIKVFHWLSKSKFLSSMTEGNPNNGNEIKLDIFSLDIFKSYIIFSWLQSTKIFQWLLYLASLQVKWNKIKRDMCKSDSIFSYLQSSTLFKWILKFVSWSWSQKWMITVLEETCPLINFTAWMLKKPRHT